MIQTYNAGNGVVSTVIWLTSELQPTSPKKASFVRMTSSDGESAVFVVNRARSAEFNPDQPRDSRGQWTSSGDTLVDQADKKYAQLTLTETNVKNTTKPRDKVYRGDTVEGLRIRTHIPNTDSISATFDEGDYEELHGLRAVDLDDLGLQDYVSSRDNERIAQLAEQIKEDGEVSPLIVGYDHQGAYVLEGNHRARALKKIGKTKAPALVVVETTALRSEDVRTAARRETRLHAIADSFSPKLEVAVHLAFARGRRAIGRSKDAERAVEAIRKSLEGTLPNLLRKMYAAGGEAAAGMLRTSEAFRAAKRADFKPKRKGPISFTFDAVSEEAISWADKHAAELIDGISETSRQAINDAVAESLEEGTDPYEAILEAVGDEARARRIAHHEPILAVHEGQREAWRQAEEDGLLTGRERPVWIVTGDDKVCPVCQGLEDKTRALDGEYSFDGERYAGPPAHVGCRCTEGLTA